VIKEQRGANMDKQFSRYLTGRMRRFFTEGHGTRLLEGLAEFDLRIRDEAVNFYAADKSILCVEGRAGQLKLHEKFAEGCGLPGRLSGGYRLLPLSEESVANVIAALPTIRANVRKKAGTEGAYEEDLVRANVAGEPVAVIDRQVRKPGDSGQNRLDIVAVTSGPSPMLVALELKQGLDNRIQDVPEQLHRYLIMLDPDGKGLSRDIAKSYQVACRQLRALGRKDAPDASLIRPGMPVRGLLVLANYKEKSRLLGRGREVARKLARPMFLWETNDCKDPLPGPRDWHHLA